MAKRHFVPPTPSTTDDDGSLPAVLTPVLAAALDAVAEAVIITDRNGEVRYWNAAATALYGFTPAEAVGQRLEALIQGLGRQAVVVPPSGKRRDPENTAASDWLTRDRKGRRFWVTATTSWLSGSDRSGGHTAPGVPGTAPGTGALRAAR